MDSVKLGVAAAALASVVASAAVAQVGLPPGTPPAGTLRPPANLLQGQRITNVPCQPVTSRANATGTWGTSVRVTPYELIPAGARLTIHLAESSPHAPQGPSGAGPVGGISGIPQGVPTQTFEIVRSQPLPGGVAAEVMSTVGRYEVCRVRATWMAGPN